MKQVEIDLAGPFEGIVSKLRSIPPVNNLNGGKDPAAFELSPEIQEVVRSIYEAARGRQFATLIGLIPAGPLPAAPFLKDAPFKVESQADFLLQALARLYSDSCSKVKSPSRETYREIKNLKVESQANGSFGRQQRSLSHAIR